MFVLFNFVLSICRKPTIRCIFQRLLKCRWRSCLLREEEGSSGESRISSKMSFSRGWKNRRLLFTHSRCCSCLGPSMRLHRAAVWVLGLSDQCTSKKEMQSHLLFLVIPPRVHGDAAFVKESIIHLLVRGALQIIHQQIDFLGSLLGDQQFKVG